MQHVRSKYLTVSNPGTIGAKCRIELGVGDGIQDREIMGLDLKVIQLATLFSSVQFSRSVVSDSLRPHGLQHAKWLLVQ